jgi:hypothetical protein
VPEDVLGSAETAEVVDRGIDGNGNPVVDLDFDILVNHTNPRAVSTWEAINAGVKLGTSIGAIVKDAKKKKDGGLVISDLQLLEASIVGIPANPRSWVQYAVKSLEDFDEIEVIEKAELQGHERHELPDSAFACPEQRKYPHHTASGAVDKAHLRNALARMGDPSNDQCGKAHLEAHARSLGIGDRDEKSLSDEEVLVAALTTEFNDAHFSLPAEPEVTKSDNEELAEMVEPDLVEGKTRVTVTVTTEEPNAQEAPASGSAPGDAGLLDETAEGDTTALGDNVTRDAEIVLSDAVEIVSEVGEVELTGEMIGLKAADLANLATALKSALTKIGELEKSNLDITKKNAELEENFSAAREIIERIADLPMGRKTYFVQATSDFRSRFPMYDDDFVRMLER